MRRSLLYVAFLFLFSPECGDGQQVPVPDLTAIQELVPSLSIPMHRETESTDFWNRVDLKEPIQSSRQ